MSKARVLGVFRTNRHVPLLLRSFARRPLISAWTNKTASFHSAGSLWNQAGSPAVVQPAKKIVPKYLITFTCKACDHRSAHEMSKQAYTKGTILIQCPSCKNRHLIADNLKIFSDKNVNIEDILAERGESIRKGDLAENGDIELLPEDEAEVKALA